MIPWEPRPGDPVAPRVRRALLRVLWDRGCWVYSDEGGFGPATCAISDLEREREKGRKHRGEL